MIRPTDSTPWLLPLVALALGTGLSGCVPAVVAGAGAVGTSALQERGMGGTAQDTAIRTGINARMFDSDVEMLRQVDLTVYDGRVMLTGVVDTAAQKARAGDIARSTNGVRDVYNHIQVNPTEEEETAVRDRIIATKLRAFLAGDRDVRGLNLGVTVSERVVYILGVTRSAEERERVLAHARNMDYVRGVVSHIEVVETPGGMPLAQGPTALPPSATPPLATSPGATPPGASPVVALPPATRASDLP